MAALAGPEQKMPEYADYHVSFQNTIYEEPSPAYTGPVRTFQLKWWFWELWAATISLALFGAVIVVLQVFNGHAIPELPLGITLNTTVSLIAAVSKTALLLVASATISQFKWLWVHKSSRTLQDLQAFDEASRGPWGSLVLLQYARWSVASLGALITILLLGFDPFIQQLITTPQRDVSFEAPSTAVHRAFKFDQSEALAAYNNVNDTLVRLAGANPQITIQLAVSNGANSQGETADWTPSCPTSNCTWPSFRSLDLCSTCMDVTDYARKNWKCEDAPSINFDEGSFGDFIGKNRTCGYNLPNSAFNYKYEVFHDNDASENYTEVDGELRLKVWTTNVQQTTFSDNILVLVSRVALANTEALMPGFNREQVQEATECALAMCVQEHSLSVVSGIMHHTVKSIEQPFSMKADEVSEFFTNYTVKSATINNQIYSMDGSYTLPAILQNINSTLIGNITVDYTTNQTADGPIHNDGGVIPSSDLATSFYAGLNFTRAVDNMATSVSRYIRGLSDETTAGRAHSIEVYVHVKWEWIAFPAGLVGGGVLLLIIAMIQTSQTGLEVWKSSSLPLWFHGQQNDRLNSFGGGFRRVNTLMEMEAEAGQIQVSLAKLDDGSGTWALSPTQSNVRTGFI